jgi:Rieske Fe-S protein
VAAAQPDDLRNVRPQIGDQFAFATGAQKGNTVTPADVVAGGPPVTAFPRDSRTGVSRDGSRLNQVLLLRLGLGELTEETRGRAADGIVAYSGVCTHEGCDVTIWKPETQHLGCPCHESEFDPRDGARVVGGPAPRRLPALPLGIVEGALTARGGFSARPGPQAGG